MVCGMSGSQPSTDGRCVKHVDEICVGNENIIDLCGEEGVNCQARRRRNVADARLRRQLAELRDHVATGAHQRVTALAADGDVLHGLFEAFRETLRRADDVGVVGAGQAAIGGDEHDHDVADIAAFFQQRVHDCAATGTGLHVEQQLPGLLRVGTAGQHARLGAPHAGSGDGLKRAGYLRDVADAANAFLDFPGGSHLCSPSAAAMPGSSVR